MTVKTTTVSSLIFCFSFSTAFAEDPIDTRIQDMQSRKDLESRNLQKARTALEEVKQRIAGRNELSEEVKQRIAGRNELSRLKEEIENYQALIKADQENFDSYQQQYKVEAIAFAEAQMIKRIKAKSIFRKEAIGEKIESLTTTTGRTYQNAVISAITPFAMNLRHSAGIARIPYMQLPDAYITRFEFDAEEAQFSLEIEKAHRTKQESLTASERAAYNNSSTGINIGFIERQISRLKGRLSYYSQVQVRNLANAKKYSSAASSYSYSSSYSSSTDRSSQKEAGYKATAAAASVKMKQYEAEIKALQQKIRNSK